MDYVKHFTAHVPQTQPFPDLSRHSKSSRIGRKRIRKALDVYHRQRRESGTPARSGPPIPGSEKHGRREFYTLEQAKSGGRIRGERQRGRAKPKHDRVRRLHGLGFNQPRIARIVGYSQGYISRILAGKASTAKAAQQSDIKAISEQSNQPGGNPVLALCELYIRRLERLLASSERTGKELKDMAGHLKGYRKRKDAYILGIRRNAGDDVALAVVRRTTEWLRTLFDLDIAAAIRAVNGVRV